MRPTSHSQKSRADWFPHFTHRTIFPPPRKQWAETVLLSTARVDRAPFLFPISPQPGLGSGVSPIARVQRGPSQAARCASRETPRSLAHHRRPMMTNQQPLIPDPLEEIRNSPFLLPLVFISCTSSQPSTSNSLTAALVCDSLDAQSIVCQIVVQGEGEASHNELSKIRIGGTSNLRLIEQQVCIHRCEIRTVNLPPFDAPASPIEICRAVGAIRIPGPKPTVE